MTFEFDALLPRDHIRLHLAHGEANAVTHRQLARDTGYSVRVIQQTLESMKRDGEPIVTGSAGVWVTDSAAELREFYRANRRRIHTQFVNARGTLKAIAALERYQQQTLWRDVA